MIRFKTLLLLILTHCVAIVSLSQQAENIVAGADDQNPKTTIKVDEFGRVGDCDLGSRIDNLFIQINNNPGATGYVLTYAGFDFLPSQVKESPLEARIRRAIAFRKYDMSRLVFINGGFRESASTELFLVPDGSDPPQATDTVLAPEAPQGTYLWSRSGLQSDDGYDNLNSFILPHVQERLDAEEKLAEIQAAIDAASEMNLADQAGAAPTEDESKETVADDIEEQQLTPAELREFTFAWADKKFAAEVASSKDARGVMIFYIDDQYYDTARVKQFVEEGRDIIAAAARLRRDRVKVLFGGYRESPEVEYYIVPKKGRSPQPRPGERTIDLPPADTDK